jgi:hypothetical protein
VTVLRSDGGCEEQPAHSDYDLSFGSAESKEKSPLGAIFAVESGTQLKVWPKCFHQRRDGGKDGPFHPIVVTLVPYDLLLFRGDLLHAGYKYNKYNCRLHFYLDSTSVKRVPGRTYLASEFPNTWEILNHTESKNNEKDEKKKKKKKRKVNN